MAVALDIMGWRAWHDADGGSAQPDVSKIPSMLRRRLSRRGRAALSVMLPLVEQYGPLPVVFVSRHGEVSRTLGMLEDLAAGEPLSPAAFSLSVHNAIAGLYSIQEKMTGNITAIAAGGEDLVPALLEACGMTAAGGTPVLCVFCDEPVPSLYASYCAEPQSSFALALVVGAEPRWALERVDWEGEMSSQVQALQLHTFLVSHHDSMRVSCNGSCWQLRRMPA